MQQITKPRYPDVTAQLTGRDGNAFAILGEVSRELKRAGVDPETFMAEATTGDYDHLLRTAMAWVNVA